MGWLDAVRDGLAEEMRANPAILYFGEGTGERGGSFAHTKGLWRSSGRSGWSTRRSPNRGSPPPPSGASATGARTVSDLMFADFAFETAGQIFLQAAKLRYMSNGQMNAPMVVRVGAGALRSAGPHHSGIYHPVFAHMPGLIVCVPSTPADAKGLMKTALRAGDPVHHAGAEGAFRLQGRGAGGRALRAVRRGAHRARGQRDHPRRGRADGAAGLEAAEALAGEGHRGEVIDLRTIMPLDVETIVRSVRKTHRLLVVDEGWAMCGDRRRDRARRSTSSPSTSSTRRSGGCIRSPTSHPFAPVLERAMLVDTARIVDGAKQVLGGVRAGAGPLARTGARRCGRARRPGRGDGSRRRSRWRQKLAGGGGRASRSPCRSAT